jgi:multidrug efflux pump subunit AcrB
MSIKLFINRPILATVISLGIIVCGLIAAFNLPIEQYPKIAPPSIAIIAQYPGDSAETMEKTIAAQFENYK